MGLVWPRDGALTRQQDVRHQIGVSDRVRRRFARHGSLSNDVDVDFRGIMSEEPIFAYSKSFELNADHSDDSVLFTLAHIQDPVVQFAAARGLTMMKPLWSSQFESNADLLTFHYYDYPHAAQLATTYSTQLNKDAFASGAADYADIVALSARQVLGATSFSGTTNNPILFLKEISSNGNFQTIDVIFPSFPFFLYTNPRWLAYLLEPLLEHMLSGQYPNDYAMHDLGLHFPNATGHPDGADEYMPGEECGNILIMGQALVNSLRYETEDAAGSPFIAGATADVDADADADADAWDESAESAFPLTMLAQDGDVGLLDDRWGGGIKGERQARKWVKGSYRRWRQWTGYLVEYSLEPANQLSTDDFAGWLALQTNLALKGILGIKALSGIAAIAGQNEDAKEHDVSPIPSLLFLLYTLGRWNPGMIADARALAYRQGLRSQMAELRSLSRRHPRQAGVRLVRLVDDAVQPLRGRAAVLPPRGHRARPRGPCLQPLVPRRPAEAHSWARRQQRHGLRRRGYLPPAERLVLRRAAEVRPAARQPPPVRQVGLGVLCCGRHGAPHPRRYS